MTLINYTSRVHFADGILEVALNSELELNQLRRPLLVSESQAVNAAFEERVRQGAALFGDCASYEIVPTASFEATANAIRRCVREHQADVLIAFGSSAAMEAAELSRRGGDQPATPNETFNRVVPLFAIPGIDGLPGMSQPSVTCDGQSRFYSDAGIQPAAVFYDPTLIQGESVGRTASALANTFARCLSVRLSQAYNPPADGIATDGLRRIVSNFPAILNSDSLDMRRELMAASLNGTLALQKHAGISCDLSAHLVRSAQTSVDEGALMRLLIPIECELSEKGQANQRVLGLRQEIGLESARSLRSWAMDTLQDFPLPSSLQQLGLTHAQIAWVAVEVSMLHGGNELDAVKLEGLLNAVNYQPHPQPCGEVAMELSASG